MTLADAVHLGLTRCAQLREDGGQGDRATYVVELEGGSAVMVDTRYVGVHVELAEVRVQGVDSYRAHEIRAAGLMRTAGAPGVYEPAGRPPRMRRAET
jgi:hypothetical protein